MSSSALHAETMVVKHCLERAAHLGMTKVILETDAAVLGSALTSDEMDRSLHGCLFRQIRRFMITEFESCIVSVCAKSCNRVADSLSAFGEHVSGPGFIFMSQAPEFVSVLVSGDLPRARG